MKTSIFKCVVRAALPEERDILLSKASIEEIQKYLPNINVEANSDLLPIVFDSCVVNKFNKNGDGIQSDAASSIAKNFIFKPINVEHKKTNVAGVILGATYTSISGHKELSQEEAASTKDPYYITLSGVLWKYVRPELAEYVEECSDPFSEDFGNVSASWELSFEDYKIALRSDNSKNIEGSEIIEDKEKIEEIENSTKGKTSAKYNGKKVYRIISGGITPIGIGLVENPAADVKGVATPKTSEIKESNSAADSNLTDGGSSLVNVDEKENNTSINKKIIVIESKNLMKLTSLDQITEEFLKTATAGVIREFFEEQIKIADKKFLDEKSILEKNKVESDANAKALKEENDKLNSELESLKKKLDEVQASIDKAEKQRLFDARMEIFDSKFELTPEVRKILASELPSISSQENFDAYFKKMESLLSIKKEIKKVVASVENSETASSPATVVEDAVKNGEKQPVVVPNAKSNEESFVSKFANAFSSKNVTVQIGRKYKV